MASNPKHNQNNHQRSLQAADNQERAQAETILAAGIPKPNEFAGHLLASYPKIARALKWAHNSPAGYKVHHTELLAPEMRSMGLLEASGTLGRQGYHLSAFGMKVLRELERRKAAK